MIFKKYAVSAMLVSCIFMSGCGGKTSSVVKEMHSVGKQICNLLDSINDKDSAEKAIPKLEELAKEFTRLKNDITKHQKENPNYGQEYRTETTQFMMEWGQSLAKFNTNENVPPELKKKIMNILSI